ncbi:hypothetical protein B0H67DRAFT_594818 [Lasiosphaeris hirsuta]|uniref:Uncharacterized protein n=1 Tax=Lasiosphaeris hirsuta TaxID=260670 RepID=A0AA39ZXZ8_9PEZI|nr:hypothetical protein B0H67DRAFT_594818 [Lasiosphaeris hirsuta]
MMKRLQEQREKLDRMRESLSMAMEKHSEKVVIMRKEIGKQRDLVGRLEMVKEELERIKMIGGGGYYTCGVRA